MVDEITTAVTGILTAITNIISPSGGAGSTAAAAYAAIFALPVLGGVVAFSRRLIKKSR